jgi:hypothetical protein
VFVTLRDLFNSSLCVQYTSIDCIGGGRRDCTERAKACTRAIEVQGMVETCLSMLGGRPGT